MRVAIFDAYPHVFGGSHVVHRDIADAGTRMGSWTTTVIFPDDGVSPDWLRKFRVPVTICQAPVVLLAFGGSWRGRVAHLLAVLPAWWIRLAREMRAHDVVHVIDLRGFLLGAPSAVLARRPLVFHVHNGEPGGRAWRVLASLLLRTSLKMVVPSRRGAVGWAGKRAESLLELPNAAPERPAGVEGPTPTVVTFARLHPAKGLGVLLDALGILEVEGIAVTARILGTDTPGLEDVALDLRARAKDLGDTEFVGFVEDSSRYLVEAWVYVQPSLSEPFGLGALEASATGLPVVASEVGGLVDVVLDGQTGLLVPAGSATALAQALKQLLQDPDLRERLGTKGRLRAECEFGAAAFAKRIESIYASFAP